MLAHLYAAFAPLKIGMDILVGEEGIKTDVMIAQGGLFRTPVIAQQILANMLNLPITLMETAGEGGSWGMAVLACFAKYGENKLLADFLDEVVFQKPKSTTLMPEPMGGVGCEQFMKRYKQALPIERAANILDDD